MSPFARFLARFAAMPAVVRWGGVAIEMAVLWWASSGPLGGAHRSVLRAYAHNAAHVVAYSAMAAMALLALAGTGATGPRRRVLAIGIACAYGAIDEIHQKFVPGRVASFSDFGSDLCGAVFGAMLVHGLRSSERGALRLALVALLGGMVCSALGTFTDW